MQNKLKGYAASHKWTQILMVLLSLISGGAVIAQAYLVVRIVTMAFIEKALFQEIIPYLAFLLIVLIT
ncbi:MAG: thiol reductant ABC exporter subunit CydD, partial [Anaerobacillus sp.]